MKEEILRDLWRGTIFADFSEFKAYVERAFTELKRIIRHGEGLITYGELGRKIGLYSPDYFDIKIGQIVGACSHYASQNGAPLISSCAISQETGRPGKGFWGLPGIPPHLRMEVGHHQLTIAQYLDDEREAFWSKEVKEVMGWNWGTIN